MCNGAGRENRTPDLRFTKPLHYRCATPALCVAVSGRWGEGKADGALSYAEAAAWHRPGGSTRCSVDGSDTWRKRDPRSLSDPPVEVACVAELPHPVNLAGCEWLFIASHATVPEPALG